MQTKICEGKFTSVSESEFSFSGYVGVFGNVDAQTERLLPGSVTTDFAENGTRRPLLWNHKPDEVLGWLDLEVDSYGIRVKRGYLLPEVQRAREVYALIRAFSNIARIPMGMSIGFQTEKSRVAADGVRELHQITLWEGSLTPFPANSSARVTEVRTLNHPEERQLRDLLAAIRTSRENAQLHDALATLRRFKR